MPVTITKDNTEYYLVPAPLVSFSRQTYNNVGRPGFGVDYSVSLEGTLVPTHGNPFYSGGAADLSADSWTQTSEVEAAEITEVSGIDRLNATIRKQELIRDLFSNPVESGIAKPIKVKIKGWEDENAADPGSGLYFYGFVEDVAFGSEGRWANPGSYTVRLRTSNFINSVNGIFASGNETNQDGPFVSNVSETFNIQEAGRVTISWSGTNIESLDKIFTVERSMSAVGSPVYDEDGGYLNDIEPWQQASGFVHEYLLPSYTGNFGLLSSSISSYGTGNYIYTESIDKEAGSYSLSESFILYKSGSHPIIEEVSLQYNKSENGINEVTVQGQIEGINSLIGLTGISNKYTNALSYVSGVLEYNENSIVNTYNYAKSILDSTQWLNPKLLSKSYTYDVSNGRISYNHVFNDRPPHIIPGSISESVQINDTYPGEIFSVTPVIGRSQPVLQYLNSRSEYKRSLSINVTMDSTGNLYTSLPTGQNGEFNGSYSHLQNIYINQKPSVLQPASFNMIYQAVNPVNDPNFTVVNGKCYHSAPTESWDARTRNYTYNIEWTYERY